MYFSWKIYINRELTTRILELGDDAVVVEPESLRKRILEVLRNAIEQY
ncbi:WYL domain-containing protein [Arundinibacter roseus]|uniref:WYL domain-containing protein n=1 Tax=Arundinibacter roseus TaxID=2070510 RepID=A0A4R4K849_9BACT|nr:WYL domain-containing protein [Arundinibacter roseus]